MTTEQVEFTETELLMDHDFAEPLMANGERCHGGFDEDGTYVSPRTRFRAPAIEAWEQQRLEQFGTPPLDIPVDTWPVNFPNIEQSKFLIRKGAPEPTISALTRIGTIEGFGSMLRLLPQPDLQPNFVDSIAGTATDHIRKGLFEAHARDEAGFEDEAGHDRMWFAARDIAFENPVTQDETEAILARMGIGAPASASGAPAGVELLGGAEAVAQARAAIATSSAGSGTITKREGTSWPRQRGSTRASAIAWSAGTTSAQSSGSQRYASTIAPCSSECTRNPHGTGAS